MIKIVENNIKWDQLQFEVKNFIGKFDYWNKPQVSITSVTGEDDFFCSVGKIEQLEYPERAYKTVVKELQGSYVAEVVKEYSKYYRWRLLNLQYGQSYTIHSDNMHPTKRNKRLHIPIVTNPDAYFCYHSNKPEDGKESTVKYHHLAMGNVYEVDTSTFHNAINWGLEPRVHLVGVRYE